MIELPMERLLRHLKDVQEDRTGYDDDDELQRLARLLESLIRTVESIDSNDSFDFMKKMEAYEAVITRELGPERRGE